MNLNLIKKILAVIFLIIAIMWFITIIQISPNLINQVFGDWNKYLILGILAFIGGSSLLVPFPYYLFTISFATSGLNPLMLGICAGFGTLIGDSISYLFGRSINEISNLNKLQKIVQRKIFQNKRAKLIPVLVYLYASIIPLPDDLIMIPAGVTKYPYKKMAVPLFLGKVTFNTILAVGGFYGFNLIF